MEELKLTPEAAGQLQQYIGYGASWLGPALVSGQGCRVTDINGDILPRLHLAGLVAGPGLQPPRGHRGRRRADPHPRPRAGRLPHDPAPAAGEEVGRSLPRPPEEGRERPDRVARRRGGHEAGPDQPPRGAPLHHVLSRLPRQHPRHHGGRLDAHADAGPLRPRRQVPPLHAELRARAEPLLLPLPARPDLSELPRGVRRAAARHHRARRGRTRGRRPAGADPGQWRADPVPGPLRPGGAPDLRRVRDPLDLRRDPDRVWPDRPDVRAGRAGRRPGHAGAVQVHGRGISDRGRRGGRPAAAVRAHRRGRLHLRQQPRRPGGRAQGHRDPGAGPHPGARRADGRALHPGPRQRSRPAIPRSATSRAGALHRRGDGQGSGRPRSPRPPTPSGSSPRRGSVG